MLDDVTQFAANFEARRDELQRVTAILRSMECASPGMERPILRRRFCLPSGRKYPLAAHDEVNGNSRRDTDTCSQPR